MILVKPNVKALIDEYTKYLINEELTLKQELWRKRI
jgi:hypothetical protein